MKTNLETIREIIEDQFLDIVEDILEPFSFSFSFSLSKRKQSY